MAEPPKKRTQNTKRTTGKSKTAGTVKRSAPKKPAAKRTTSAAAKPGGTGTTSKYKRRKQRRKRIMSAAIIALISIVAVILIFVFFFRVGEIRINGSSRYSKEEIVAVTGINKGDNTLTVKKKAAAKNIMTKLPFIESAKLRIMPTIVTIEVTEAVPAAVYKTEQGRVLLSSRGKILEIGADDYIGEVPLIKGVSFDNAQVGSDAVFSSGTNMTGEDIRKILEDLFIGIAKYDLDIRVINWEKPITMKLNYAETLIVDLGYPENLDDKLNAVRCFIEDGLIEGEKGILRVSDVNNISFTYSPNEPELTLDVSKPEKSEKKA